MVYAPDGPGLGAAIDFDLIARRKTAILSLRWSPEAQSAMAVKYDRPAQTTGNIVHFEHVNVTVPDPIIATIFWFMGMGFTRDPYLMVGVDNMWANIGMQQFHLPDARAAGAARRGRDRGAGPRSAAARASTR